MKIYGIGGLGADKRVFDFLKTDCEFIPIEWIEPSCGERLEEYSYRLSKVIDVAEPFCILGVSFGGLVAVEISKILNPNITILISSIETKKELRFVFRMIRKMKIIDILPARLLIPHKKLVKFLFGTNLPILNAILNSTDIHFVKWAAKEFVNWDNCDRVRNLLRIHGTHDKIIPWKGSAPVELVEKGQHFMIVDRATEISQIINEYIKLNT